MSALAREELLAELAPLEGRWWHSIELGDGIVTAGRKSPEVLAAELRSLRLPDLRGKRVLDVGAWDGYFSFACEERGAAEVVALDHFVWSFDPFAQHDYVARARERGEVPLPYDQVPEVWRPDELPGKACFDLAVRARGSKVRAVVGDVMEMDLEPLGTFDVVLFLGVLYHLREPLRGLERIRRLVAPGGVAIIETAAVAVPGFEDLGLAEFFPGDELNGDPTNWWAPNLAALVGMCRAAGFERVEPAGSTPEPMPLGGRKAALRHAADTVVGALRAGKAAGPAGVRPVTRYRAVVQAWAS